MLITSHASFDPPSAFFTGLTALNNSAYTSAFDIGIYFTTDNGNNWYPAGFPSGASGYAVKFVPAEPGMVLAGTNVEPDYIYASFNNSHNFVPYSEGLGVHAIAEALTSNDSYSFAGTSYNGIWRRTLPGVTAVNNSKPEKPNNFSLRQNYPNPFNPETTIEYSIPKMTEVKFSLYNILGEEVDILVDGITPAGTYRMQWDAKDYPSGTYFFQIQTEDFKSTRKMLLLK